MFTKLVLLIINDLILIFLIAVGKLQIVLQSLRRLSALEKVSDNWERP